MGCEEWAVVLEGMVFVLLLVWMLLDRFGIYFRKPDDE